MSRVLVVGEELSNRLVEMILSRYAGDTVDQVFSVEAAYERCRSNLPDLAVMSWTSVGVTWGDEFTRALRALPGGTDIPLILVSAYWAADYIARIHKCGGDTEILAAPFTPDELLAARSRLLGSEVAD